MPTIKNYKILIGTIIVGSILGGVSALYEPKNVSRTPSTIIKTSTIKTSKKLSFGKASRPFDVFAVKVDESQISGLIVPLKSKRDVYYKWILPEGVRLVSGDLEGSWSQVSPGSEISVDISVDGLNSELEQQIVLQAWHEQDGSRFMNSAAISTKKD